MPEQSLNNNIIGIVGTILGTITGFLLNYFTTIFRENKIIKSQLKFLLQDILLIPKDNLHILNYKLSLIRTMISKNTKLLKKEIVSTFYDKWLRNNAPIIEIELEPYINPIVRDWDEAKFIELKLDIEVIIKLRIFFLF